MDTNTINPEDDCSNISNKDVETDPDQELQTSSEIQTPETPQTGQRKLMDTPIRVRDMINLYNFATQKNQELEMAKSLYFGAMSEEAQRTDLEGGSSLCNMSMSEDKEKENESVLRVSKESVVFQSPNGELPSDPNTVERSYQSKTTIRHTNQGVRIIIDIFFDKKDNEIDIVGSRVETDIPESRILSDFQQHALDMQNQEQKPEIQDGSSTPKST
ncbi:uncharacterized protein LOC6727833 [Drosophila simulans]|uniref:uncharacterized protein LOC6727833 n=1 Tax=Drosophila simulans TaxID=7240 RepID=UPI00078ADEF3|nr:uncharacterized protein LOC6727833 [Drosophila simulans]KMZ03190.1 uncharacterized protein Dsimw501_GD20293 [Drosophila simulans]